MELNDDEAKQKEVEFVDEQEKRKSNVFSRIVDRLRHRDEGKTSEPTIRQKLNSELVERSGSSILNTIRSSRDFDEIRSFSALDATYTLPDQIVKT